MSIGLAVRFSMDASGRAEVERVARDWSDIVSGNAAVSVATGLLDFLSEEPSEEPGYTLYRGKMTLRIVPACEARGWDPGPFASEALGIAAARQQLRVPGLRVQFSAVEPD